jgi:hypothetical protein
LAFGDYLNVVKAHEIGLAMTPLLSLEPELSNPDERRILVAEKIPYAILLEPDHPFQQVLRPPEEDHDTFDSIAVRYIFDYYKPRRNREQINYLEVRDLRERKEESSRMVPEFLVEVPSSEDGRPVHFVAWPALPPAVHLRERLRAALKHASRAASLTLASPALALRMHQFHHPHEDSYRTILKIVDAGIGGVIQ